MSIKMLDDLELNSVANKVAQESEHQLSVFAKFEYVAMYITLVNYNSEIILLTVLLNK